MSNGVVSNTQSTRTITAGDGGRVFDYRAATISASKNGNSNLWTLVYCALEPVTESTRGIILASAEAPVNPDEGNRYDLFLGFALDTVSAGSSCRVQMSGVASAKYANGYNSYNSWYFTKFYLSALVRGRITETAPSIVRKVGTSVTANTVQITNIW